MAAISREIIDTDVLEKYRICSKHFVDKPAELWDESNVAWLPTFNLRHLKRKQLSDDSPEKCQRAKRKQNQQRHIEEMNNILQQQIELVLFNEVEKVIKKN